MSLFQLQVKVTIGPREQQQMNKIPFYEAQKENSAFLTTFLLTSKR